MIRIGFLLNHDAAHQVMHCIPSAYELARRYPDVQVVIISTTTAEEDAVKEIAKRYEGVNCILEMAKPPAYAEIFDRLTGHALLAKRFGVLWRYKKRLAELDALIVPDKTTLMLKKWLGNDCPVLINTFHGAGDRSGGYRGVAGFDYHLLPGRKYKERMLAEKLVSDDRCSIVGYVKFDQFRDAPRPKLFDNDRKTILYAPHFDPRFSSWFGWGEKLLKLFANNEKYNFIFAPHVLLFRRRWHISTEGGLPHITPKIPDFAYEADNFIVDPGSISSINMTYTRAADIYIGDVSSLVYEFQLDKRPCFFLNKSQVDWRNNENFRFWTTGKVIESFDELGSAVDNADIDFEEYREEQERAFSESFDLNETLSAVRAADAIIRFLAMEKLLPDNISPEAR